MTRFYHSRNLIKRHVPGDPDPNAVQGLLRFPNGYGLSVIRHRGSYGNQRGEGLYEAIPVRWVGRKLRSTRPLSFEQCRWEYVPVSPKLTGWPGHPFECFRDQQHGPEGWIDFRALLRLARVVRAWPSLRQPEAVTA